ncbi:sensor histidine kinase [Mycobacterium spongiae]|uniref:histidine kinase n=1 Tax=Mycobacterium spongiae TaxID=886343 RepID=A0A975PYE2_9MYCO|nr:HAMP domain-containing sensor histidine kinase [Mycobacterium spongiae]QUR69042.1 HAMP domain-containing protein [Mycobacterium spongiae]
MATYRRGRMPLRVRLVAATLILVGTGLALSGVAVTTILRDRLISRLDRVLVDEAKIWVETMLPMEPDPYPGHNPDRPPSRYYVRVVDPAGQTYTAINDGNAEPAVPADNDVGPDPVTLPSVDGSKILWRAVSLRGTDGTLITVAGDLADVRNTVRSLEWLQLAFGTAVLVMLGVAGYAVVRHSLRPLAEVEETAAAIAAGELDRRVPQWHPRTEVGRLSLALNGMLAQIQQALASSEASAERARDSEARMRRFITDASHELRTPLTTIRGFAELYRQGAARDVASLLARIENEASQMGLLVDDLLLLARLDAQRPLERQQVDLLVLASDAVHAARATDPERTITLEVVDGPGTPEVLGDEQRLRQVLSNLVANALRHTPKSAHVSVRVGTEDSDAVLEVADTGPGMSREDALRVFERFFRTDSSRARSSGGTGLGLSIVDSLVRAHGGAVSVATEPGKGCCFRVTMPRVSDVPASV